MLGNQFPSHMLYAIVSTPNSIPLLTRLFCQAQELPITSNVGGPTSHSAFTLYKPVISTDGLIRGASCMCHYVPFASYDPISFHKCLCAMIRACLWPTRGIILQLGMLNESTIDNTQRVRVNNCVANLCHLFFSFSERNKAPQSSKDDWFVNSFFVNPPAVTLQDLLRRRFLMKLGSRKGNRI